MTRLSRSRVAVATGLTFGTVAASLAFTTVASAAEFATPIAPATVVAGTEFEVTGEGCPLLDEEYGVGVIILSEVEEIDGVVNVDPDGSWVASLTFPADTPAGPQELLAGCDNGYSAEPQPYPLFTVNVTAAASVTPPAPAPVAPVAVTVTGNIKGTAAITPGISSTSAATTAAAPAVPGKQVTKVLKGFKPGEKVTVVLHSTPQVLGTFTADANGVVTATFTVPAGTVVGDHTLVFEGNLGSYYQETFTVAASTAVTPAGSNLAYTGADVAVPLALGGALVLAGGGALFVSRRRNTEAAQA